MAFPHHLLSLLVLLLAPAWVSSRPPPARPSLRSLTSQECFEFNAEVNKMQKCVERDCSQHRDCSPPNNTSSACCLTITSNATATISQEVACEHRYFITGLKQLTFDTSTMRRKLEKIKNHLNYRGMNTCKVQVSLQDFCRRMKTLSEMLMSGDACK